MQWGFTSGKSITGALLAATDHWHRALDSGHDICTIFFDYSKAFDSVPHRPLLDKLRAVNVSPYILKWLASYLFNRMEFVCVGGVTSQLQHVISGVPQGSALGPSFSTSILMILLWCLILQVTCLCTRMTWCYITKLVLTQTMLFSRMMLIACVSDLTKFFFFMQ